MTPSQLSIGWARRDITPELPVCLCGMLFVRKAEQVLDRIFTTALALQNQSDCAIWLSMDVAIIPPEIVCGIQQRVHQACPEIAPEKILVSATHTHTAPYLAKLWHETFPPVRVTPDGYGEFVIAEAVEAILEAWRERRPGAVGHGFDYAVVGHLRRMTYLCDRMRRDDTTLAGERFESSAAMYGPRAIPEFKGFEGYADHRIDFVFTYDEADKPTGVMVSVHCPAQATEWLYEISADFWTEFRANMCREFGPDFQVLPLCGAAGDIAPRAQMQQEAEEAMLEARHTTNRQEIADRIALALHHALEQSVPQREVELSHRREVLKCARQLITDDEYRTAVAGLPLLDKLETPPGEDPERFRSALECRRHRARTLLQRYEEQKTVPAIAMEVHVIRLGDTAWVTFPQELFTEYACRIKCRSHARHTMVVQLTGAGISGYLATDTAQVGGGYSASAYCNSISPAGGGQLVEFAVAGIAELFSR